jgi:prepilin-type N-terminal cleavage/methylation domain-containing protein
MSSSSPRGGFTMVELLISLVLASLIAGIVFDFVVRQGTFTSLQAARQEALQNARTPLLLISSELRAASSDELISGRADTLELMVPRVSGVFCSQTGNDVYAIFPKLSSDVFTTNGSATGVRIKRLSTSTVIPIRSDPLAYVSGLTFTALAGSPCVALRENAGSSTSVAVYRITVSSGIAGLSAATPGDVLYLYDVVRYDMATTTASGVTSTWLRRSYGAPGVSGSSQQPMAGPLAGGGFRLQYQQVNGTTWSTAPPGRNDTDLSRVKAVRVTVVTTSKILGKSKSISSDSASVTVALRNN